MVSPGISIHAPREGSDGTIRSRCAHTPYFYPRSPRGERRFHRGIKRLVILFLSTLPARGATRSAGRPVLCCQFLSTLPARGATLRSSGSPQAFYISIHAPREGSDCADGKPHHAAEISIHAPREGSDLFVFMVQEITERFLSTLPARGATIS